jgi:hypothetical protein
MLTLSRARWFTNCFETLIASKSAICIYLGYLAVNILTKGKKHSENKK